MRVGKLSGIELKECVLDVIQHRRDEIKTGAALGEDCASFKIEDILLISTDPITGASNNIGSLAIKVASNDIFAAGGEPFLAMITLIAPPKATPSDIKNIMEDAEKEAKSLNIEIAGGHTEFSDAVNRFVINTVIVGKTKKHIKATSLNEGDSIIVTKTIGLEGSVILAEKYEHLLNLTEFEKKELLDYSRKISLVKEYELVKDKNISSMHDITEGGLFGALAEICEGAGMGCQIYVNSIPVSSLTRKICNLLNIDCYNLISSGSMIITTRFPEDLVKTFSENGIEATIIGKITKGRPMAVFPGGQEIILEARPDELFTKEK
ncbi:MAG: Hydrogenase isoenzymes formation protein HypE [Firmicutes bacterium ADurb.Bin080]|jgi:hydrogenase expression/formation protein HypE|nr:AIR synthase [Clostridiales bacterium]OQC13318.1 MAG: Hydrogenase isoenzymes formation protein HypE [Firmicutes bacterium ADurb.Bin080]